MRDLSARVPNPELFFMGLALQGQKRYLYAYKIYKHILGLINHRGSYLKMLQINSIDSSLPLDIDSFLEYRKWTLIYGAIIASYSSEFDIPDDRRVHDSWDKDYNSVYPMHATAIKSRFRNLPWLSTSYFSELSFSKLIKPSDEFIDPQTAYLSRQLGDQIRMAEAPIVSGLVHSVHRKISDDRGLKVVDIGGAGGNSYFLSGFDDSWDLIDDYTVFDLPELVKKAALELPEVIGALPEKSAGKKNLAKLRFQSSEKLKTADISPDLIYSCKTIHYISKPFELIDYLLSLKPKTLYFESWPYLATSSEEFNVSEIVQFNDGGEKIVHLIFSSTYLEEHLHFISKKYNYSLKIWDVPKEECIASVECRESDHELPMSANLAQGAFLLKACSVRLDSLE